jgi:hypothetical protein
VYSVAKYGIAPCGNCLMPFIGRGLPIHAFHCRADPPRLHLGGHDGKQPVFLEPRDAVVIPTDPHHLDGIQLAEYFAQTPPLMRSVPDDLRVLFAKAAKLCWLAITAADTESKIKHAVVDLFLLPRVFCSKGKGQRRIDRVRDKLTDTVLALEHHQSLARALVHDPDAGRRSAADSVTKKAKRARAALRSGAGVGFAMRKIDNNGVADPADSVTLESIKATMPAAAPPDNKMPPLPEHYTIQADDKFLSWLCKQPPGRAPGPSGWTTEMLVAIADDADCLRGIARLLQLIDSAQLPNSIKDAVHARRLTPANKTPPMAGPMPGNIRPIIVEEVFVRLAKKRAVAESKPSIMARLAPIELSFGIKGGNEKLVHLIREALATDLMCVAIDIKNAFGTRSRNNMFDVLFGAPSLKRLWRVAWDTYRKPVYQFATGSDGKMHRFALDTGVGQGDPLGLLYALSQVEDLRAVEQKTDGIMVRSFQDNIYILGKPEACLEGFNRVQHILAPHGSIVEPRKCAAVWHAPEPLPDDVRAGFDRLNVPITRGLFVTLGAAITPRAATPERLAAARNEVKLAASKNVQAIAVLNNKAFRAQEALTFLRYMGTPSAVYLARTTPPHLFVDAAKAIDAEVEAVFAARVLQMPSRIVPAGKAATLMTLPMRLGGIGLLLLERIAHAAWLASLAEAAQFLHGQGFVLSSPAIQQATAQLLLVAPAAAEHLPPIRDGEHYPTVFQDYFMVMDDKGKLVNDPDGLQKRITRVLHDVIGDDLKADAHTSFDKRHLEAIRYPLASAWLRAPPTDKQTSLRDVELKLCMAFHLDLPLAPVMPRFCACDTVLATRERSHLLTCKHQHGNGHIGRHDGVLGSIQASIVAAGGLARVQVKHLAADQADRRVPDLEAMLDDTLSLADVAVITSVAKSHCRQRDPMDMAAKAKHDKYQDMFGDEKAHADFVPLIFDAYGGFGKAARAFVQRVQACALNNGRRGATRVAATMVERIAFAIQRGNARTALLGLQQAKW